MREQFSQFARGMIAKAHRFGLDAKNYAMELRLMAARRFDCPLRLRKGVFFNDLFWGCARIVPINEGSVVKRWEPKNP
jgi:hypothetical protein